MKTIRQQLTWKLLLGFGLLLGAGGAAVYFCARASLLAQFDAALRAKAQALTTLTEQDGSRLKIEFSDEQMPAFEKGGSDFFELWRADEKIVERSRSLGEAHLPFRPGAGFLPLFWNLALPGDRPGRALGLRFRPQNANSRRGAAPLEAVLVVASERQGLDHTLATLGLVLGGSGLLLLAATALVVPRVLGRELKPLRMLADHAARISAASLSARFPTEGLPGELAPIVVRLNELLARLQDSFERERRFSSDAAHEFRTPVAELRSLAELALKMPEARPAAADQEVLAIALHLESVLTRLLDVARREQGQMPAVFEPIDVAEVVASVCRPLQAKAAARQLAFQISAPATLRIQSDPALLRSILANVVDNAVEYAASPGVIQIQSQAENGDFEMSVTNPVEHLSREDLDHLFDRFWRKDPARASAEHAGLGLALAQAFAQSLGCTLKASLPTCTRLTLTLSGPIQPGGSSS
jgi:signal transduction histidine kinase